MTAAIGTRIKRARERRRWSQRQLAEALKVDRKTVDNWENNRTSPRSSIGALEEVLGVSLDGDEPEPEPEWLRDLRDLIRDELPPDRAAKVEAAVEAALQDEPKRRRAGGAG